MASTLRLAPDSKLVEYCIRAVRRCPCPRPMKSSELTTMECSQTMLALNVLFNGTMWALFTRALTLAPSAVRANVINAAANFLLTALLGALVFGEVLPAQWFVGAGLLVAGSVIIGAARGEDGKEKEEALMGATEPAEGVNTGDDGRRRTAASGFDGQDKEASTRRRPIERDRG